MSNLVKRLREAAEWEGAGLAAGCCDEAADAIAALRTEVERLTAERDRLRAVLGKIDAIYRDWRTGCTGSNDAMISIAGVLPDSAALEPPR